MSTLDDVLALQNNSNVLQAPVVKASPIRPIPGDTTTLTISLYNATTSNNVFAYITGLAINDNYAVMLIEANGSSIYYPSNPPSNGSPLTANCSIPLGAPGTTVNATIPYIAGGRIWFCEGQTLTFLLNPSSTGAQLVEPSVTNTSDPNYYKTWDFCEFTYNSSQIYANISYVDFVCLPVALTLSTSSGDTQHVSGMPSNGLTTVCNGLIEQNNKDGAGWNQLIVNNNGSVLRALSPTNGIVFNNNLFANYWTSYVNSVYNYYVSNTLTVDTQAQWGNVTGQTSNNRSSLTFAAGSFTMPNAAAIFSGASGAFAAQANNTAELLNIGARLDAAFNRSTLLIDKNQPNGEQVSTYYQNSITNHYARIVHAANLDGFGYCFPYDDVTPTNGTNVSGFVADGNPTNLLVTVGGGNAYASKKKKKKARSEDDAPKFAKRSISWLEDVKEQPIMSEVDLNRDLEKGQLKLASEMSQADAAAPAPRIMLPAPLERVFGKYLTRFYESPAYNKHIVPLLALLRQVFASLVSLSVRAIISRVFILLLIVLLYFFDIAPRGTELESQKRVLEAAGLLGGNSTLLMQ